MIAPLTPEACDLQDFPFMPLHVARLRDSDLAAEESAEACWYAVLLWAASWHQLPAASLPDNDAVLMRLVGLGRDARTWKKHRAGALRGFVLCEDGRLYHPVVAEQACEAWQAKLSQRWRTECARIKKHNQRHGTELVPPSLADFIASGCMPVSIDVMSLSQGTGSDVSSGTEGVCPPGNSLQETETGTGIYKEEGSEARASAAASAANPDDPGKSLFDRGTALLVSKGSRESQARSFLAKMQKEFGNPAVLDAIERCRTATDPLSAMRSHLGKARSQSEYLGV